MKRNPDFSWEENFKRSYESIAQLMFQNRHYFKFMEQCTQNPMLSEASRAEGFSMFMNAFTFLEDAKKAGSVKDLSLEVLMAASIGPLFLAVNTADSHKRNFDPLLLLQLRDCAWDAIKT